MLTPSLDDLLAAEDSLDPPDGEFERHSRYLGRCRRVRAGPSAVVVFENARTLRFRLQELARLARLAGPERVRREVGWYASLLPGRSRLVASVTVRDPAHRPDLTRGDGAVRLWVGPRPIPGRALGDPAGDRIVGLVRWVEFRLAATDRTGLADPSLPLVLEVEAAGARHESPPLDPAVRVSLLSDLGPPDGN
jgi:hypothetical protein